MRLLAECFALVLCAAMVSGCATQRVIIEDKSSIKTNLFITRAGDKYTIAWESRPDLAYTVLYNSSYKSRTPWQILPGLDSIRGTGRMITYVDLVPAEENRVYRIDAVPAVSLK